ncbi:MAG: LOG family protein [Cellvibrionales bacterium]|nr:LOG family protein [Cellvibrionales bacterium]
MRVTKSNARLSVIVSPASSLQTLSQREISYLYDASQGDLYEIFRQCALAVLSSGSDIDDIDDLASEYHDFSINVIQQERGVKLELLNAPSQAFVDGEMIKGIKEHLFSVLRDIIFIHAVLYKSTAIDSDSSEKNTDTVFNILRNAGVLIPQREPSLIVCWGGHSIAREEYEYTKNVGYQLGLRGLDICTGCGPGAMKGPMKGAAIAHGKQRNNSGRYVGLSEPGIIAAESPNALVNELVVLPDIEKRLEAFVRCGHGIIVFPGGVGTAEEIFYLLALLLHPSNAGQTIPLAFTAPQSSVHYFEKIDEFIALSLGENARSLYKIIIDDPVSVAQSMSLVMSEVQAQRKKSKDAYFFNWSLTVPLALQQPFTPSHENMADLNLHTDQSPFNLAVNLRAMFSALVAGNVKAEGLAAIERHGPYQIRGDANLMNALDDLLRNFVASGRMKISSQSYRPCYEIVS